MPPKCVKINYSFLKKAKPIDRKALKRYEKTFDEKWREEIRKMDLRKRMTWAKAREIVLD